ncbi:DUF6585 family protein [Nocardia australiensis]|uniref:DUF6585 family protein n=1 Tax=Nocardia australiensis TaxID=2887191 RepID=UPI001D1585E5|nr:DUF6585 family protein [Nocardia australiensis]
MTTPSTVTRGDYALPQLIHLMAEYQKLGSHRQSFPSAPASDTVVRGCEIAAGGLVAVGVICVLVGAYPGGIAVGLLALIPAAVAFFWTRRNRRNRAARLDLFEFGMTVYRSGEKVAGFRWDSAEVRQQVIPFQNTVTTDYALAMTGPDGTHSAFDNTLFIDAREWGRAIQSAITATQLSRAVTAIDAGETVRFGDIALHLDALTYGGKIFAWEQVQLIDARSGLVRMKVDGNWESLTPVGTIPNFYIFNELAERLRVAAADEFTVEPTNVLTPQQESDAASSDAATDPQRAVTWLERARHTTTGAWQA